MTLATQRLLRKRHPLKPKYAKLAATRQARKMHTTAAPGAVLYYLSCRSAAKSGRNMDEHPVKCCAT
jgi:hypothetical protein